MLSVLALQSLAAQDAGLLTSRIPAARQQEYADLAVKLAKEYFAIDTTNPPGNEARAAAWLKNVLDSEGIANQVFTVKPGRDNIIARLPGSGAKRPIVLLSHEDVVTASGHDDQGVGPEEVEGIGHGHAAQRSMAHPPRSVADRQEGRADGVSDIGDALRRTVLGGGHETNQLETSLSDQVAIAVGPPVRLQ